MTWRTRSVTVSPGRSRAVSDAAGGGSGAKGAIGASDWPDAGRAHATPSSISPRSVEPGRTGFFTGPPFHHGNRARAGGLSGGGTRVHDAVWEEHRPPPARQ